MPHFGEQSAPEGLPLLLPEQRDSEPNIRTRRRPMISLFPFWNYLLIIVPCLRLFMNRGWLHFRALEYLSLGFDSESTDDRVLVHSEDFPVNTSDPRMHVSYTDKGKHNESTELASCFIRIHDRGRSTVWAWWPKTRRSWMFAHINFRVTSQNDGWICKILMNRQRVGN